MDEVQEAHDKSEERTTPYNTRERKRVASKIKSNKRKAKKKRTRTR